MASRPRRATAKPEDPLEKEALERLEAARQQKGHIHADLYEAYCFAAPHRAKSISSRSKPASAKPGEERLVDTNFFMELSADFPTEVLNTFMPITGGWAERKAGMVVPEAKRDQVERVAAEGDRKIFDAISASNFYAEYGKGANPDLGIGILAMWIDHRRPWEPVHCQSIPIRELEINLGPYGGIDDRFVVRHTKNRYVKTLLKGIKLPPELAKEVADEPDGDACVVWGFWRLWDEEEGEAGERWQYVVLANEEKVHGTVLKGAGSCPLIVARFGADNDFAWPRGPMLRSLADASVIDELTYKKTKAIDFHIQPPTGIIGDDLPEDDIEAGMIYSFRGGTEIKTLYDPPPMDPAIYFSADVEQRVKRIWYLDRPEQRGKTPPTASQWLDEMTMRQQRIGTPGLAFWNEGPASIFVRFQYLLEKAGAILEVKIDGKVITLLPYNPAQKSVEQQEVAMFARFVQIAGEAFPEEFKLHSDGAQTIIKLAKKMGVDAIWVQRNAAQIAQALNQLKSLAQNTAPAAPEIPGPQAPPADVGPAAPQPRVNLRQV
jgi:Bacteriophage head to tail connecting protein